MKLSVNNGKKVSHSVKEVLYGQVHSLYKQFEIQDIIEGENSPKKEAQKFNFFKTSHHKSSKTTVGKFGIKILKNENTHSHKANKEPF